MLDKFKIADLTLDDRADFVRSIVDHKVGHVGRRNLFDNLAVLFFRPGAELGSFHHQ
ncbi:hypothetical protein D3C73_1499180 [compost metagenome]